MIHFKLRTRSWKSMRQIKYDLREHCTRAEEILWKKLNKRRMGNLRFRRQHGIGPYVADFYHAESMTVIEIDGSIHEVKEVMENDKWREEYLIQRGYKIIRFKNEEVFNHLENVIHSIYNVCVTSVK